MQKIKCSLVLNSLWLFQKSGSSEKREVRQFQFLAWPDHGVPECPTPILAFLRRVKACHPPDSGPMVVHCRYCASNASTRDWVNRDWTRLAWKQVPAKVSQTWCLLG